MSCKKGNFLHCYTAWRGGGGDGFATIKNDVPTTCGDGPDRSARGARSGPARLPCPPTVPGSLQKSNYGPGQHLHLTDPDAGGVGTAPRPGDAGSGAPVRIHGRHASLPAQTGRRPHGGNGADAGRRAGHDLYFQPGGMPGGLQVLHDGADGAGAEPHGRRNRGAGAAGGTGESPAAGGRAAEHRDDGARGAAAEPGKRGEGDADSAGPGGLRTFAAADHSIDGRHHPEDRGVGKGTGAAEAGDFAQRLHRGIAAGTDADHAQIPSEGSDGGVQGLSVASVGEADLRIRAAARGQR